MPVPIIKILSTTMKVTNMTYRILVTTAMAYSIIRGIIDYERDRRTQNVKASRQDTRRS